MLVVVSLALALQAGTGTTPRDSIRQARRDSVRTIINERIRDRERTPPRRLPVTPELERSAFLDAHARELLLRARDARMRQDSSLLNYDATSYQRISVGLGFRAIGRDRLLFRTESASHVRWSRDGGAWIEVKGRRTVTPSFGDVDDNDLDIDNDDMTPLPYYPGREALWVGSSRARAEVDERELVHPLAIGSEAYYKYSSGDSLNFTLPDKKVIRLQELRVEPRRPEWKLSVGSFWFDAETGQLVRAVYRLAVPIDIWAVAEAESRRAKTDTGRGNSSDLKDVEDDVPKWVKGLMSPLAANLEAVTIEYGLFGTRFWMPRTQYAEGWAKAGFMRVPFKIESSFKYASVNGDDPIPPIPPPPANLRDSLFGGDTTLWRDLPREERRRRLRILADAAGERARQRQAAKKEECAKTGYYTTDRMYEDGVPAAVRMPCDTTKLATAPELPPSIYDSGEQLFGEKERQELLKALDFSLQPGWAPQPIVFNYGLAYTRYNRVEALSTAVAAGTQLGKGYSADAQFRIGVGDWAPNGELNLTRSNGRETWRLGAYRRLTVANEEEAALGFGASLGAFIFGRDDGQYYRTLGGELEKSSSGGRFTTRLFAEYASPASVTTSFNLATAVGSATEFRENFTAVRGTTLGVEFHDLRAFGLDPQSWRAFTDLKAEGGWFSPKHAEDGDAHAFWGTSADITVSRGFGDRVSAALTVAGGMSEYEPIQRQFFLGGSPTVRGQLPATQIGETYWLGRLELGGAVRGARPMLFGDIGWAGPRSDWSHPGRPQSGVGIGLSIMDGLIRADYARGIYPRAKGRFDMYFEARF